jgi:ankyrin repeat protein
MRDDQRSQLIVDYRKLAEYIIHYVLRDHESIVRSLLDKGVDVQITNKRGRSPLYWASVKWYETIFSLLMDNRARAGYGMLNDADLLNSAMKGGMIRH